MVLFPQQGTVNFTVFSLFSFSLWYFFGSCIQVAEQNHLIPTIPTSGLCVWADPGAGCPAQADQQQESGVRTREL